MDDQQQQSPDETTGATGSGSTRAPGSALFDAMRTRIDTWEKNEGEIGAMIAGEMRVVMDTVREAVLAELEADLRAIKDGANESAAGDPPAGYEELAPGCDALRIADECYHAGFDAMETAIRNWIYDQRQSEPNAEVTDA